MIDLFNKFEKENKKILENDEIWPFMRLKFYYTLLENISKTKHSSRNINTKLGYIFGLFYGFTNLFKKFEYYFFSDTSQRKILNGKYFDKLTDPIIDQLGKDKCLQFELPSPNFYKVKQVATKHVISQTGVEILSFLIAKIYIKFNKNKIDLYEKINIDFHLNIDYKFHLFFFKVRYKLFTLFFKLKRPKAIFIVCYYDKAYIVKAAKDLNIKVIELQHGVIGKVHPAYYSYIDIDKSFVADYLLSFGEYEKKMQKYNGVYNSQQVFPIGHFYIEYLVKNFKPSLNLLEKCSKFKIIIGVTLQDSMIDRLLDIVELIAIRNPSVLFIIIPREDMLKYRNENISNILLDNSLDCYQKVLHCDFHMTVYSSCAIEAPSLGIKNILFNIDNFSVNYFAEILNQENTEIINTVEELENYLNKYREYDKNYIINSNANLIKVKYIENIKTFIKSEVR